MPRMKPYGPTSRRTFYLLRAGFGKQKRARDRQMAAVS